MSFANTLNGILRRRIKPIFGSSSDFLAQQTRNTYILKRKYPLPLHPKDRQPHKFKSKNYIYELIEDTNIRPQKEIDVILTSFVPGVGSIGDKVSLKPSIAYNEILLLGLGVYASPENMTMYKDVIEKAKTEAPVYSSKWALRTTNILSTLLLNVVVSQDKPWILQKYHIRAAFRKLQIHVPDRAITMPTNEIVGPDLAKENKEFYVIVTVNNKEKVKVRCRLLHYTTRENDKILHCEFWKKQEPAIFPEDQPILDAMPGHRGWKKQDADGVI